MSSRREGARGVGSPGTRSSAALETYRAGERPGKGRGGIAPVVISILAALAAASGLRADVLISEIMYHPLQPGELEYIELHNTGGSAVPIAGWSFTGLTFTFPAGAQIAGGAHVVVVGSRAEFEAAYPTVPSAIVFGDFTGALDNSGEAISLRDGALDVRDAVAYQTDPPWEFLADGFGASLERLCFESTADAPENWRASSVPPSAEEFGGSPGAPNLSSLCPPEPPGRPLLFISEIMYHPVLEQAFEDDHEFIEIWNGEPTAVPLAGWRLAGAIDYTFGPGTSVGAGERAVIARKKTALAAEYGLNASSIHGDYARTLDNGGEKVALIGPEGQGVDSVTYDDDFPWPVGADALGADDEYLKASLLPLTAHQYRGISLERVSFDLPSGLVANWAPSPLDGSTPGSPNASARATPLPIVEDLLVQPAGGGGGLIRASDQVLVQARFSPASPSGAVELQYFIDNVASTGEPVTTAPLRDDGGGGDLVPGDMVFSAVLPARSDNSIVRYRVRADLEPGGAGVEIISPRPTDPYEWHAYFVSPVINTQTRVYQVFISPANWTQMWDNITSGRVSGCAERSSWDAKVPAVFVYNGKVTDARVRYQGSRYNRTNGPDISSWPFSPPTRPSPVRALSWRIGLPRYGQLDGGTVVTLNKLTQGCPGYDAGVGFEIFRRLDIPAPTTRYARLHLNGGYYHYMLHIERPDEDMIRRYNSDLAAKYPERPREEIGHLFKSAGCNCDEGPYGWGDERRLLAACGHSALTRYSYTYDRKSWSWAGHVELMDIIEDLNSARQSLPDTTDLRAFLADRFDLDLLIDYVAVLNWSVPFDDMFQNHFLYQRRSDGKWIPTPWDLDLNFGGWLGANASVYMGEQNDPDNRSGWWNYLKDALIKAYRPELEARMLELTNSLLAPASINSMVDAVTAQANPAEAASAPAGVACNFPGEASAFKSFASARRTRVNTVLSSAQAVAGPDQSVLAGSTVQFDATASRPDPGPGAIYTWSNGMTGERPTFLYPDPGTFVVTLTITVSGVPYRDSCTITVVPAPEEAFQESNGTVVIEAESFYTNDPHGSAVASWETDTARAGFSGPAYMLADATTYTKFSTDYGSLAPELRYTVLFQTTGTYYVWVRGFSDSADYDSVHVGLDGSARDEGFATRFIVDAANWLWSADTRAQGLQTVTVATPGVHFLSLWIRESGQIVDKVILTKDSGFTPTGAGPAQSPIVPISGATSFVRGNVNRDGAIDLSDGIAILLHLFAGGSSLNCEDTGDVDDDGTLGISDAIGLFDYLFRGGPSPEPPFPGAGLDPTPDAYDCGG